MSTPTISPLAAALKDGLTLNIKGSLPGETLMVAMFDYAKTVRVTMDPPLQKRLDAILVQQLEDVEHLWRSIWVELGVLPK